MIKSSVLQIASIINMSLTQTLRADSTAAFDRATRHVFLQRAGMNTLPEKPLLEWLLQDRLYAESYVSFIGTLLSKIDLSGHSSNPRSLEWRITQFLIDALINIRRELGLFEQSLQKLGWGYDTVSDLHGSKGIVARPQTRAYMDLFDGVTSQKRSVLEGLTALWATERCYLEAWQFAKSQSSEPGPKDRKQDELIGTLLSAELIPNWTSDEFVSFVGSIESLLDEFAEGQQELADWEMQLERCKAVWRQVLWAEEAFWPDV